jgi:AraC-like DNA-binding protein
MDALVGFLNGPRARGAFLLRSVLDPPWSLRIRDEAPLTIAAVVRGTAWVMYDDDQPRPMHAGDVAVMRGPDHYTVADSPDTAPQVIIHPGQLCTTLDGVSVAESMRQGVRTWGNNPNGATVVLTGTYQADGEISRRLTDALPRLIVLRESEWHCPVVPLLADEIGKDDIGQEAVLDRLLDLLVVAVLRAWFARPDVQAPTWYRAHTDPIAGHALRLLHNNPAHPWTVGSLAAEVGVSRAALARRFTELVGEPPIAFLTGWRLTLAADLLLEPDATVGAVARRVGYSSPFTFSTAFKRRYGLSPNAHRRRSAPPIAAAS